MTPGRYDLELYRGDSHGWRFTLWANFEQTMPVDLTGASVAVEIRDKSAGTHIVDLDVTIVLPNSVDVKMTPDMYVTCPTKGVWDFQITFPGGEVHTPLYGDVKVTPDVTDSLVMPAAARR
jgi:hypothetical protein